MQFGRGLGIAPRMGAWVVLAAIAAIAITAALTWGLYRLNSGQRSDGGGDSGGVVAGWSDGHRDSHDGGDGGGGDGGGD